MRRAAIVSILAHACGGEPSATGGSGESSTDPATTSTGDPGDGASTSTGPNADTSSADVTNDGSASDAASSESTGEPVDPAWQAFLDRREDDLLALKVPIAACVVAEDTSHPAFHGCIDWHSAVHATYSLLAIHRLTGDAESLALAEATLDPDALAGELADLQDGGIPFEVPYGYAWFLTLARERECATGATDLVPHAELIAAQLRSWLAGRTPTQIGEGVLADDYANVSWAVLNLWQWAQHANDDELAAEMETFVAERLMDPAFDAACPLTQEITDADSFFPPCLHRLRTIVTVLPPTDTAAWLAAYLPAELALEPIGMPSAAHVAGLNFSRAWGLWAAHVASGDTMWRDMYVDHVVTHIEQPEYWAENYGAYAHWVAQFGVYAIAQTYDGCE